MLWTCPLCGSGKQAPERPRLDATVRFCLTCSAKSDRLVRRVCKALEQKRQKKVASRRAATSRKRETQERTQAKKIEQKALVAEQRYLWAGKDLRQLWSQMMKLPTAAAEIKDRSPELAVRKCSRVPYSAWGRAWFRPLRAQVSVWQGLGLVQLIDTMIHELAHLVSYLRYGREDGRGHGPGFKRTYTHMFNEWKVLHPETPARADARWYLE